METTTLLTTLLLFISFEWINASTAACPNCSMLLSVSYNARKSSMESLLATNGSSSIIIAALGSLEGKITDQNDKTKYASMLKEMERDIVQNADLTNQTKLVRIALKLDQLFLNNAAIEDAIRYEQIAQWGPLCDYLFIVDEMNIGKFWELATTTGTTTPCLLYDLILEAATPNKVVKWYLYLEDIPCTMSRLTVTNILNLHHDIPDGPQQLYLKTLELHGYDMTVNQVQRIARSYYSSKALSCRRIKDTLGNYPASKFVPPYSLTIRTISNSASAAFNPSKTTQYCIDWLSSKIVTAIADIDSGFLKCFNKIYWNHPYGTPYETIIYSDCQIAVLKKYAPNLYN